MATLPLKTWQQHYGNILQVKVTPGASSNRIIIDDDVLTDAHSSAPIIKVYVTQIATAGKANEAVLKLLAKALGVPKTSLKIKAGGSARVKTIVIAH